MLTSERQERATQAMAWLCVVAVHAGLSWPLVQPLGRGQADSGERVRLRLLLLEPARQPAPVAAASLPRIATAHALPTRTADRRTRLPPYHRIG